MYRFAHFNENIPNIVKMDFNWLSLKLWWSSFGVEFLFILLFIFIYVYIGDINIDHTLFKIITPIFTACCIPITMPFICWHYTASSSMFYRYDLFVDSIYIQIFP